MSGVIAFTIDDRDTENLLVLAHDGHATHAYPSGFEAFSAHVAVNDDELGALVALLDDQNVVVVAPNKLALVVDGVPSPDQLEEVWTMVSELLAEVEARR